MKGASAAVAIAVKDWTRFARQPFLMVISVVIPLVFIFFYSLIIPVSNNNPIMVADLDGGPVSSRLIETMRTIHSEEGPYYDVRTTDATPWRSSSSRRASPTPPRPGARRWSCG